MGGGERNSSHCSSQAEEESVESLLYDLHSHNSDDPTQLNNTQREYFGANEGFGGKNHEFKDWVSSDSSESEILHLRRRKDFEEIMQSYDSLKVRVQGLEEAKHKILCYKPGSWTEEVGYFKMKDYNVPETTTLILVGLSGSGKSSLVNRISRVFEDDKVTSERAQVSYNFVGDGTLFLHEYMIPRGSKSFCLYDTRGLYENPHDNFEVIKNWMTKGVRHGELVLRDTDSSTERNIMKCKARQTVCSKKRRMVNFVIFVIDAHSVLKIMNGEDDAMYTDMLKECFSCPYLFCKDDKPVVVCTHGDLLSHADRAHVRIHLGELLGIPPAKQIFDIPENRDPETDVVVVDMLTYSLVHADNNFPIKRRPSHKMACLNKEWSKKVQRCHNTEEDLVKSKARLLKTLEDLVEVEGKLLKAQEELAMMQPKVDNLEEEWKRLETDNEVLRKDNDILRKDKSLLLADVAELEKSNDEEFTKNFEIVKSWKDYAEGYYKKYSDLLESIIAAAGTVYAENGELFFTGDDVDEADGVEVDPPQDKEVTPEAATPEVANPEVTTIEKEVALGTEPASAEKILADYDCWYGALKKKYSWMRK